MKTSTSILGAATTLLMALGTGTASAITVTTIDGSYTVDYTPTNGGMQSKPKITDVLGSKGVFSEGLTLGGPATTPVQFLTIAPFKFCIHCGPSDTATGTVTVTFAFTEPTGATGDLTETGSYSAKYAGSALPCSGKTFGANGGQSDCIQWSAGPTGNDPLVVKFSNGDVLDVTLNNFEDWDLKPTIDFQLQQGVGSPRPTPLPPALALFGSGLGVFGFFSRRRAKVRAAVPSDDPGFD